MLIDICVNCVFALWRLLPLFRHKYFQDGLYGGVLSEAIGPGLTKIFCVQDEALMMRVGRFADPVDGLDARHSTGFAQETIVLATCLVVVFLSVDVSAQLVLLSLKFCSFPFREFAIRPIALFLFVQAFFLMR